MVSSKEIEGNSQSPRALRRRSFGHFAAAFSRRAPGRRGGRSMKHQPRSSARRGHDRPHTLVPPPMDHRYLRTLRALAAGACLAACERRPDRFEPPTPLVTPGASLLDASGAAAPFVPAPIATPTVVRVAPVPRTPQEMADAYKRDLIARGCPETLPSGPRPPGTATPRCTYDACGLPGEPCCSGLAMGLPFHCPGIVRCANQQSSTSLCVPM